MFNLLSPSVAVLNKLKFTRKFALIFILYLIPVAYVIFISFTQNTAAMDKAELEKNGLSYMVTIRPLFEHMAETRGMTNAYLYGKTGLLQKIKAKRSAVEKELIVLLQIDKQMAKTLKTEGKVQSIISDWNSVVKNAFSMKPDISFAAHTEVIKKVLELKVYVMETSKLLFDPSVDSNFMASALALRIPTLAEYMGKTRGLGAGIISDGGFTTESFLTLNSYLHTIEGANKAMMHGFDVIFENNLEIREQLSLLRKEANKSTKYFIELTKKDVLTSEKASIDSAMYFSKGSQAINANLKLYDTVMPLLDGILLKRRNDLQNKMMTNIVSSIILLLAALYIFAGFYRSLMNSINGIKVAVHAMANGDLTAKVKIDAKDEMQLIANDMNMMIEKMNALVGQVISSANQVVISSEQSGAASVDTRDGVNQQNMELELVATAMNEMSATVHEVANNAESTAQATRNADKEANNGRTVVNQTIQSINNLSKEMQQASGVIKQLEEDTESIGSVLDVIRGIAEQTNLLALNAAIEAARAGEQGRGFAVVADEVRTLASRTQDSTQEIQAMIEKLQQGSRNAVKVMEDGMQQTEETVAHAAESGKTLESIAAAVELITSMNEQIASAAEEQSSVAEEINRNVVNVRDIAVTTADNANKTTENSATLNGVASQLKGLVAEFKVN